MAPRFERVVMLRLPDPVYREVVQQARADDRPICSFLRKVITAHVAVPASTMPEAATDGR